MLSLSFYFIIKCLAYFESIDSKSNSISIYDFILIARSFDLDTHNKINEHYLIESSLINHFINFLCSFKIYCSWVCSKTYNTPSNSIFKIIDSTVCCIISHYFGHHKSWLGFSILFLYNVKSWHQLTIK